MHTALISFKTRLTILIFGIFLLSPAIADEINQVKEEYSINPGDVLSVHVWGEAELSRAEILVRPDGRISMPIVGQLVVGGRTINDIQSEISKRLDALLLDDPVVSISVIGLTGNTIYVLGKVARPGEFIIRKSTDITKALALAGGVTTFAKQNSIKVLRRNKQDNEQTVYKFRYGSIEDGKHLEDNILLQSGDVVIVP